MAVKKLNCRFCGTELNNSLVDLGEMPLANNYLENTDAMAREKSYPLHARVCSNCFLVQVEDVVPPEDIFSDYAYFSSYSESWVKHAKDYADQMQTRLNLTADSLVIEVASNDGYLLQHFVADGIPVLGIEPAANVAKTAIDKGVATEIAFFGLDTASRLKAAGHSADLIAANNVLAHVPDINDFVSGFAAILAPRGVLTIEFPHLLNLIAQSQFDTIYHEHYSYLSLLSVEKILQANGLKVFDVEELPTHGGSLRIFACLKDNDEQVDSVSLEQLRQKEKTAKINDMATYSRFAQQVEQVRASLLKFLRTAKTDGKHVAAYGAAAKGNTLLNYCGVTTDLIDYVVDRSTEKQDKYLPGSHLPIHDPARIFETKPDYILILPWNLADEISAQMAAVKDWGGRFVIPIPGVRMLP